MEKNVSPCGCGRSGFDFSDPQNQELLSKARSDLDELLEVLDVLTTVDRAYPVAEIREKVFSVSKGLTCALKGGSKCFPSLRQEDIRQMIQAMEYLVNESSLTTPSIERIRGLSAEIAETIRGLNTEGRLRIEMMAKVIEKISLPSRKEEEVWLYPSHEKGFFQRIKNAVLPCGCRNQMNAKELK